MATTDTLVMIAVFGGTVYLFRKVLIKFIDWLPKTEGQSDDDGELGGLSFE